MGRMIDTKVLILMWCGNMRVVGIVKVLVWGCYDFLEVAAGCLVCESCSMAEVVQWWDAKDTICVAKSVLW